MPTVRFRPTDINSDIAPWELPENFLSRGQNIEFTETFAAKVKGDSEFIDPSVPVDYMLNNHFDAQNRWLFGSNSGLAGTEDGSVQVTTGVTIKDITPATITAPLAVNRWSGCVLVEVPYLCWGTGESAYWDNNFGAGNLMKSLNETLANDGANAPICRTLRAYKSFLIALNTVDHSGANNIPAGQNVVAWSDAVADPESIPSDFEPLATNLAGSLFVGADTSGIQDGAALRNDFLIFKNQSTWVMTLVGGTAVMGVRPLFTQSGVLSNNCIAEVDGNLIVLTTDDVVMISGEGIQSIIDNKHRRTLFQQLGDNYSNAFVTYYPTKRQVWICLPTGTDQFASQALVWDVNRNVWGQRQLGITRYAASGVIDPEENRAIYDDFPSPDFANTYDGVNRIYNLATADTARRGLLWAQDSNSPEPISSVSVRVADQTISKMTALLERRFLPWDDLTKVKTANRAWPKVSGQPGDVIEFRLGASDSTDGPVNWGATNNYTIGADEKIDTFVTGRWLHMWARSRGAVNRWEFQGADIDYEVRGNF